MYPCNWLLSSDVSGFGAEQQDVPSQWRSVSRTLLAALDEEAAPAYDRKMAQRLAGCGMEIAALTPEHLAQWLAKIIG